MKKISILFLSAFLLSGCASSTSQEVKQDVGIIETEPEQTSENIIEEAWFKLQDAKSFDMEYMWEATPCNDFFAYEKMTISGTFTDVQNEVFEGYYKDERYENQETNTTKMTDMVTEGPITKKAGEDAILPAEYNGGYEYSIGTILMFPELCPSQEDSFDEYSQSQEKGKSATRYMFHVVDTVVERNQTSYQQNIDYIYEVDNDGDLTYFKKTVVEPFRTNAGVITDQTRTTVTEFKYNNIEYQQS